VVRKARPAYYLPGSAERVYWGDVHRVEHRLIHDDLARQMLPGRLNLQVSLFGFKPLRQGFLGLIERGFPGTRGGFCRKGYIDDKLVEASGSGIDTGLILGSGLNIASAI